MLPGEFFKIFRNIFLQKTSIRLLLLNTLSFDKRSTLLFVEWTTFQKCYPRPCFFCCTLNFFRANSVDHLHVGIPSAIPRQQIVTELMYCWQIKRYVKNVAGNQKQLPSSVLQKWSSVKHYKYHKKVSVMESLLSEAVSPSAYNCSTLDAITGVFLWIYIHMWIYFFIASFHISIQIADVIQNRRSSKLRKFARKQLYRSI